LNSHEKIKNEIKKTLEDVSGFRDRHKCVLHLFVAPEIWWKMFLKNLKKKKNIIFFFNLTS